MEKKNEKLKMLNPTADMEVAANKVLCQVPLQCIEKCKYKKYPTLPRKVYEVEDEKKYLDQADPYWAKFLRSQADSSAKYLYRMSFFGSNRDPTMVKKEPFPPALIHQRLLHMPVIGTLDRDAMFYMLCFILNMLRLNRDSQKGVLKKFRERNMIDNEILIYMQLISRHPNTGLTNEQRDHVIRITQDIINEHSTIRSNNYFNPDHIFKKSFVEIDPYELEYLKSIMHTTEDLTKQQFLYLTMLVERLQEMPFAKRDQYLKVLHSKGILPSEKFTTLSSYLTDRGKRFDSTRLKILFQELETLMDIAETMPPTRPAEIPKKYISTTEIKTDAYKVTQTLEALMKGAVENIVRLNELKNFLKNLMSLTAYELESTLNSLKNSYVLDKDQFQFLTDFITAGRLRGDPKKLQLLTDTLEKVSGTPIGTRVPDNAAMGQGQGGAKKKLTVIKAAAPIIAAVASKERMLAMWSIQSLNQKAAAVKKPKKSQEGIGVTLEGKDASGASRRLGSTTARASSSLSEKRAAEMDPTFTGKGEAAVADKNLEQTLAEMDPTSSTAKAKAPAATIIFEKTETETDPTNTEKVDLDEAAAADKNLEETLAEISPSSTGKDAATPGKGHSRKEEEKGSAVAEQGKGKENISHDEDSTDISGDKEDVGGDGDVKRDYDAKARYGSKHQRFKKIGAGDQKKKDDKGQVKKGIPVSHEVTERHELMKSVKSAISAASILSAMKLDTTKTVKKEKEKGQRMDYFEYPPPLHRTTHQEYMLEGPNGPIPLIRNRALFFHFCTRSGKTNRIVSIKNGILRFR